jgi:hypothetical protein
MCIFSFRSFLVGAGFIDPRVMIFFYSLVMSLLKNSSI